MKRLSLSLKFAVFALIGSVAATAGDLTVSTSNASAVLGGEFSTLLSTEKLALNAVNPADVARLSRRPLLQRGAPVYTRDYLAGLPEVKGNKEWYCLAEALYFEARGEDVAGQFAVAEVILNRVDANNFPKTICRVVNQGTGARFRCQFTYTCDGRAETISEKLAWTRGGKIARLMLDGGPRELTGGATHYHTKAANPKWSRVFHLTTTIGDHKFYTMRATTSVKS